MLRMNGISRRPIFRQRWLQLTLLFILGIFTMGASGDVSSRFNSIGHKMMCVCGCGQILLECNHVGCPDSSRMINELRQQLASGGADTSIFNWFSAKYGPTVLAAPIRGGFDNTAWIVPAAVFLLAIIGTAFLINLWRKRTTPSIAGMPSTTTTTEADSIRERIRRETEY